MRNYLNINEIQKKITADGCVRLTFHASELQDIIHPYSLPGYEYLSGTFTEFPDRFRAVLPGKLPIVLTITGKAFSDPEKEMIDRAVRMHYGLCLAEAAEQMKRMKRRILIYLILMILSSSLMFFVSAADNPGEVVTNYGSVLFWFFAYRLLVHLVLDFQPILKEYRWYRRLSSMKLVYSDDGESLPDAEQISRETKQYAHEADRLTRAHAVVDQVLMEENWVDLGCRIERTEDALEPSGAGDLEIISSEMADYLMSALPFIRQSSVTKLTIEGPGFTGQDRERLTKAIRNYLAFSIAGQDSERTANKGTSLLFTAGLVCSTAILSVWGKRAGLAVHEFILVLFWFFADYLLEFVILTGMEIRSQKKILEKLADMEITFLDKESH